MSRYRPTNAEANENARAVEQREHEHAKRLTRLHRPYGPLNVSTLVALATSLRRANGGALDAEDLKTEAGRRGIVYWTPGGPDAVGIALYRSDQKWRTRS